MKEKLHLHFQKLSPHLNSLSKKGIYGLFIFLILFSVYHLAFANRVIPGVKIGGVNATGKTPQALYAEIYSKLNDKQVESKFIYNDTEFVISSSDFNLNYDASKTVSRALYIGRTGNILVDTKDKLAALIKGIELTPVYDYDSDKLSKKISEIEGKVNVLYKEPEFLLTKEDTLEVTDSKEGKKLNKNTIREDVFLAVNNIESKNYALPVETVKPEKSKAELEALTEEVKSIISTSPVVIFEDKTWTYEKQDLLSFLSFKKENGKLKVFTNKSSLTRLAEDIASEVNVEARGEVFKTEGERVIEFRPKTDGKELEKEKFRQDFSLALLSDNKEVKLSVIEAKAPGDTNKYGIYTLLGEGVSYYEGSIPGRIKNLVLASQRASGVLVAPGDTYSFNKSVGEITAKTGYDVAYIIQNGRTVLGEGGGVCQASTTLFRAALAAGLPIVKRSAHAYRVHYYEEHSDPGIDATVFQPSVDFQFKNDTPGYILVQADWNTDDYFLRFRIYGTPDGRKVEMTKPVVTNVTPPPEPVYEDDPNLAKGVVRQIDFPAWGATASFNRTVTRNGEVITQDTFVSRYQPWRAVYLRGTKE